jgi:hypothetical protein
MEHISRADPSTIAANHPLGAMSKKLHKYGFGSLYPGRSFVPFNKSFDHGRKYSPRPSDDNEKKKRKAETSRSLENQLEDNDLEIKLLLRRSKRVI